MSSACVGAAILLIRGVVFLYDIVTFPIYVLLQKPWVQMSKHKMIRARTIDKSETSLTISSVAEPSELTLRLTRANITDMEHMLREATNMWRERPCLGTRRVIAEENEVQPDGKVFKKFVMGDYEWRSFIDVEEEATWFGAGLRELGAKPRTNVAIFAETRAEWMVAAHGCFKHAIPVVTIYATLGEEAIAHGLNETEVEIVITSHDLLPKIKAVLSKVAKVKTVIFMEDQLQATDTSGLRNGITAIGYKNVLAKGKISNIVSSKPCASDTAIIMYTSGSTGVPKGVILSHANLVGTLKGFADSVPILNGDKLLGFLPLAHVFELLVENLCMLGGVPIGYSTPLTMLDVSPKVKKGCKGDATVLKPSSITIVPLLMDRIGKSIWDKVSTGGIMTSAFFKWAYEYKKRWYKRGFQTPLLDKIVFSKIAALLGGNIRLMVAGGAPLSPDIHTQIRLCVCCAVVAGYGLTETTSCATVMDNYDRTTGRVGPPTTGVDIRLIDWTEGGYRVSNKPYPQGEILLSGDSIAQGYYKMPEKTKEEFIELDRRRWFKTGDIGEIHPDGCLKIIDRKKDLVKLQSGEYVSLGKVESELKTNPLVENVCVYGDPMHNYTVALIVPDGTNLAKLASKLNIDATEREDLCRHPEVVKTALAEIQEHARKCKLAKFEIPAAITLCSEIWSPETGLVTAAFKIKRKDIQDKYKADIRRMYGSELS